MDSHALNILLIEDDDAHAMLIETALVSDDVACKIHRSATGQAALEYLRQDSACSFDIILLDLKLTDMHGLELLKSFRAERNLQRTPVVILTSSDAPEDIEQAYLLHINSYLTKPSSFDDFCGLMQDVKHYWGGRNRRPGGSNR